MKTLISVLLVSGLLTGICWAEKIELPPCRSFEFSYRVVLDSAGWKPGDTEPEFYGSCEKVGDLCTIVGDGYWAQCKVRCTVLKPDIPLYYWTLHRKDRDRSRK